MQTEAHTVRVKTMTQYKESEATLTDIVRHLLMGVVILAALLGLLALHAWAVVNHYEVLQTAFELAGNDSRLLGDDPLFGPLIGAFLGDVNASHTGALLISVLLAVILWAAAHLGVGLVGLYGRRRELHARLAGLAEITPRERVTAAALSAEIRTAIFRHAAVTLLLLPPAAAILYLDVSMNLFRLMAGAFRLGPGETGALRTYESTIEEKGDLLLLHLVRDMAFLTPVLLLFLSLVTEWALARLNWRWQAFSEATATFWSRITDPGMPVNAGYTAPVLRAEGKMADMPVANSEERARKPAGDWPAPVRTRESAGTTGPLREVIGSDEKVTLEAALAQPERYYVDSGSEEIWSAARRRELFQDVAQA